MAPTMAPAYAEGATGTHVPSMSPTSENLLFENVLVHLHAVSESIITSGHGHSDGQVAQEDTKREQHITQIPSVL